MEAFVRLLQGDWIDMVRREGTIEAAPAVEHDPDGEPPCPACGTAAPLVDGCCSDCGLHLA